MARRSPKATVYAALRRHVARESCPVALATQGRIRAAAASLDRIASSRTAREAPGLRADLQGLALELRATSAEVGRLTSTAHDLRATLAGVLLTEAGERCTCESRGHTDTCAVPRLRDALGVPRRRTLAREIAQVVADVTPTPVDDLALRVLDTLRRRRAWREE